MFFTDWQVKTPKTFSKKGKRNASLPVINYKTIISYEEAFRVQ